MNIYLEIGDERKAQAARQRLAEVNPEREWAGVADMIFNATNGNAAGVREAVNWTVPRIGGNNGLLGFLASNLALIGDTQRARELFLAANPGWLDPDQWDFLVGDNPGRACQVAWVLLGTGDHASGTGLLARASRHLEEELPSVVEHAESQGAVICQMVRGDTEKALATLETMLAHDHLFGWDAPVRSALFEPIRDEPRFIAAMQERARRVALQRDEIETMDEDTGP